MNEFIARKGIISLDSAQVTGSLSVTGNISASIFTGSFVGDGSQLSGIEGFPFTGSAGITGSLTVVGPVNATTFTGDGSQLTGIEGFPFTGSARITGSLTVVGPVNATSFTGSLQGIATSASYIQLANIDGFTAYSASVNTAIDSVLDATTPLTATVNTTNTPFTLTSQSIVVADSTDGNLTVRLPDLNAIVGTPNQKPIIVYKNDYSQNVIYVQPSGSQLVNGASQDIIVSIQLAVIYNPTSAGWVTEGTSAQSLAELELFFLPLTETGSLATTGSNTFNGNQIVTGSLTVTGGINATITGSVTSASYVEYANVANKPALVSSSTQIVGYNIFATTGSNQFNGSQAITGSLTVTGQVVAQTLNVQQVTSSIVYSSGSNIFGNSLSNTQQFTGSVSMTGSLTVVTAGTELQVTSTGVNLGNIVTDNHNVTGSLRVSGSIALTGAGTFSSTLRATEITAAMPSGNGALYINNSSLSSKNWTFIPQTTSSETDLLLFYTGTGAGTRMTLTSGGNVGIGTTTPQALLTLSGANQALGGAFNTTGNVLITSNESPAQNRGGSLSLGGRYWTGNTTIATFGRIHGKKENATDSSTAGYLSFETTNEATAFLSEAMRINSVGNVGIGTNSPSSRLSIAGAKTNSADLTNAANQLTVTDTTATAAGVGGRISFLGAYTSTPDYFSLGAIEVLKDNANNYGSASWNNAAMRFIVGNNDNDANAGRMLERMRITSGGVLYINSTSNPLPDNATPQLGITGASQTDAVNIKHNQDSFNTINIWQIGTTSHNAIAFYKGNTQTSRGLITVTTSGTTYNSVSDYRLKENITPLENGLDRVLQLKPSKFNWIETGNETEGFIAHELQEYFPDAVTGEKDAVYSSTGNIKPQSVDYGRITPLLVKAIQEQQSQIESLKAEIQTLKQ